MASFKPITAKCVHSFPADNSFMSQCAHLTNLGEKYHLEKIRHLNRNMQSVVSRGSVIGGRARACLPRVMLLRDASGDNGL